MKNEDVENMLKNMQVPEPENIMQTKELKIPLLSYRKSSRAGIWLLLVPMVVAIAAILKTETGIQARYLEFVRRIFTSINDNSILTYLIPVIFIGLPLVTMVINFLAICHFKNDVKSKELIITIKRRPLNIVIFLVSLGLLIFFLLPDKLAF
jgi:hypothetical protein